MEINLDHCKNLVIKNHQLVLQVTSIYAQCGHFDAAKMFEVLWNTAITSLEVLADDLPPVVAK